MSISELDNSDSESLKERRKEYYTRGLDKRITWKESFRQWRSGPSGLDAQKAVLECSGIFPESEDGTLQSQVNQVDIGKNQYINEVEVRNVSSQQKQEESQNGATNTKAPTIVVLHGYGAGLGLFYGNFRQWASIPNSTLYALDMLGFGLSSRPKFHIPTKDMTLRSENGRVKAVEESEEWFIDFLERWRQKKKLESFVLMGHSLGGYLASSYAAKHPDRVEKLVLISPAGVERGYSPVLEHKSLFGKIKKENEAKSHKSKSASSSASSSSSSSTTKNDPLRDKLSTGNDAVDEELHLTQSEIVHHDTKHHASGISQEVVSASGEDLLQDEKSTAQRRTDSRLLMYLWNTHSSPFKLLSSFGAMTPRLVSAWCNRRFSELPQSHQDALQMYVYRIFSGKPSGEYALTRILAPGAVAREPLVDRILSQIQCPSLWLYGDMDWMNKHAGLESVKRLSKLGNGPQRDAHFHIVERAGHHLYLDNPEESGKLIVDFIQSTPKFTDDDSSSRL